MSHDPATGMFIPTNVRAAAATYLNLQHLENHSRMQLCFMDDYIQRPELSAREKLEGYKTRDYLRQVAATMPVTRALVQRQLAAFEASNDSAF